MNKLSLKIVNFLSQNLDIDEDMRNIYKYGVEITLSSILNISLILICSLFLQDIKSGLLFLLCFIPLRLYTGGYHATSYFRCNCIFVLSYIFIFLISNIINNFELIKIEIIEIILLITSLPVYIHSPIKNINKKISEKKAKSCRKKAIIIYILLCAFSIFLFYFYSTMYYSLITTFTLLTVSSMMLIEIYMQRRGYHESKKSNG